MEMDVKRLLSAETPEEYQIIYIFFKKLPHQLQVRISSGKIQNFNGIFSLDFKVAPIEFERDRQFILPNDHVIQSIGFSHKIYSIHCRVADLKLFYRIPESEKGIDVFVTSGKGGKEDETASDG